MRDSLNLKKPMYLFPNSKISARTKLGREKHCTITIMMNQINCHQLSSGNALARGRQTPGIALQSKLLYITYKLFITFHFPLYILFLNPSPLPRLYTKQLQNNK